MELMLGHVRFRCGRTLRPHRCPPSFTHARPGAGAPHRHCMLCNTSAHPSWGPCMWPSFGPQPPTVGCPNDLMPLVSNRSPGLPSHIRSLLLESSSARESKLHHHLGHQGSMALSKLASSSAIQFNIKMIPHPFAMLSLARTSCSFTFCYFILS